MIEGGEMKGEGIFLSLLLIVSTSLVVSGCVKVEHEVVEATRPEWKIGDYWEFRYKDPKVKSYTMKLLEKKEFEGTMCYVLVDEEIGAERYYTLDLNNKALVVGGGVIYKYEPEVRHLDWPLWVGKKWHHSYVVIPAIGRRPRVEADFEVVRIEKVRVPAGRFIAFKIIQKVRGRILREMWYSPEVKFFIRYKTDFKGRRPIKNELLEYRVQ